MNKYFKVAAGLSVLMLFISIMVLMAQNSVPSNQIKDLSNRSVDTKTLNNEGKPYILCFWATWCKPCLEEMKAYNDNYDEWVNETGVKIIAVSIDDSRNSRKVAPFVKGKGWKFDVYLDENQDFMRGMNVTHPPHTFIINGKGEIAWSHIGFAQGDEEELIKAYKEILEKEKGNNNQNK